MAKKKSLKNSKKSKTGKYIVSIIVIAIIAVAVYLLMQYVEPDQTVAIVNGEKINQSELDEKFDNLPEQYKVVITKEILLDQLINTKLLIQEAKATGVEVTDNETEAEIQRVKEQFDSEEEFINFLEENGLTIDSVKSQINEQLLINKLLDQEILSMINIEERDIKAFYNENKDMLNISYSEIKDKIEETLHQEQSSKAINLYLEQLKSKAEIIIPGEEPVEEVTEEEEEVEETTEEETEVIEEEEEVEETTEEETEVTEEEEEVEETTEEVTEEEEETEETTEEVTEEEEETEETTEEVVVEEPTITSFTLTEDEICLEDEKPLVIFYTVSECAPCDALKDSFISALEDKELSAYIWELNTGDNLLTEDKEKGITKSAFEIFQKYNEKSTVPTIVAGCKYVGVGDINVEEIGLVLEDLE